MSNPNILIVEDDLYMGVLLKDVFENKGFVADHFTNATEGYEAFIKNSYDLCLFDVDLPDENGFNLAKKTQKKNDNVPIIFLTAQTLKEDVITGLSLGADDYIKKPFNLDELVLRVNNVLKRSGKVFRAADNRIFQIGNFQFDYAFQQLKLVEEEKNLTHKETEILKMFCENENQILKREDVIEKIWGDYTLSNIRSMDVYITRLRKYLEKDPSIKIVNVRGEGYKLRIDRR